MSQKIISLYVALHIAAYIIPVKHKVLCACVLCVLSPIYFGCHLKPSASGGPGRSHQPDLRGSFLRPLYCTFFVLRCLPAPTNCHTYVHVSGTPVHGAGVSTRREEAGMPGLSVGPPTSLMICLTKRWLSCYSIAFAFGVHSSCRQDCYNGGIDIRFGGKSAQADIVYTEPSAAVLCSRQAGSGVDLSFRHSHIATAAVLNTKHCTCV